MATIEEKKRHREQLLFALYDSTDGNKLTLVNYVELGAELGIGEADAHAAADWLVDHGLAEYRVLGPMFQITTAGIDEVESERSQQEFRLALVLTPAEVAEVEAVVGQVGRALETGDLSVSDPDELADMQAQLDTLRAQIKSPKPRRAIITGAVLALKAAGVVVGGVAGNAAWEGLLRLAHHFT